MGRQSRILSRCVLVFVALGAAACARRALPTAPSTYVPATGPVTFRVVSGWDESPVPGAVVQFGQQDRLVTDAQGTFQVVIDTRPGLKENIDVTASGFLTRQMVLTPGGGGDISLWPAATTADADAIRAMAFVQVGSEYLLRRDFDDQNGMHTYVVTLETSDDEFRQEQDRWLEAFEPITALTGLVPNLSNRDRGTDGELLVSFDGTSETCSSIWGFCTFHPGGASYFGQGVRIVRTVADRPEVIERVLASGLLNPNPEPGLLNADGPASELSLIEQQALKMLYQRPSGTRWPDIDPAR